MPREIHAREARFGRYLEDFEVGDVYHHWPGKTIIARGLLARQRGGR